VVPSLKSPVAMNCWEFPRVMSGAAGVIVIESKVALVTVNDAAPDTPANNAVMVALPGVIPVANPLVDEALLTVAIEDGDEVQIAEPVRFCVVLFANMPIAWNCVPVCSATVAVAGETCTDDRVDEATTRAAVPVTDPCCAVMVAVPAD
jgi:pyruvate/2-oxoglutarate/acetoin dehydrogenase E1 component